MVNAAKAADRHFKWRVEDCVKSLRVNKDKKKNMIKVLNEDFKTQFMQREYNSSNKGTPSPIKKFGARTTKTSPERPQHSPNKGITEKSEAIKLTQQRNHFSKARNSLPPKLGANK